MTELSAPERDLASRRYMFVRDNPTRARAVLAHIAYAEMVYVGKRMRVNRKAKRDDLKRTRKQGHPIRQARGTARQRRGNWYSEGDEPLEKEIREINRLVRHFRKMAPKEEESVFSLLRAAARLCTPQLLEDFDLDADSDLVPFETWLGYLLCRVLEYPDPDGYLGWKEEMRGRAGRV